MVQDSPATQHTFDHLGTASLPEAAAPPQHSGGHREGVCAKQSWAQDGVVPVLAAKLGTTPQPGQREQRQRQLLR